ncbi:alcohol dehydrogenase transcription factor myb/SANT-like domain-containing protein [Ditylenchus destructor]|nr:alcohol dehydrogenase transcription factor myb/SANT-like domain-containing protein [Ditylenchus destructor]
MSVNFESDLASIGYMKKVWPHEDKITLISLARNYDVLWNTAYPFYRELTQRKKALEEIKELLENKYCVEDINSQWRNLKDVFYKKKALTEKRAKGDDTPKEPAWRYYEPLKYLLECEEERKNIMRKRSQCNIQLQQLEEMRRKRKQQLMMERTWQAQMKNHSAHQFDNLEDFDNVYGDYIKELEQNFEVKPSAAKSCNLDLNLDHFSRTSINLDSPELMSSFHDSRIDKEIKKEMDEVDIPLDNTTDKSRRINDGEQDSDFTEYSVRNSMERTYNDDRELCHRYNADHNIEEKNGPTAIGSTTDALLAVVNAASSSHTGNYVESALLDLHQQSPCLARQLVQSIYQTVAEHQAQLIE